MFVELKSRNTILGIVKFTVNSVQLSKSFSRPNIWHFVIGGILILVKCGIALSHDHGET